MKVAKICIDIYINKDARRIGADVGRHERTAKLAFGAGALRPGFNRTFVSNPGLARGRDPSAGRDRVGDGSRTCRWQWPAL